MQFFILCGIKRLKIDRRCKNGFYGDVQWWISNWRIWYFWIVYATSVAWGTLSRERLIRMKEFLFPGKDWYVLKNFKSICGLRFQKILDQFVLFGNVQLYIILTWCSTQSVCWIHMLNVTVILQIYLIFQCISHPHLIFCCCLKCFETSYFYYSVYALRVQISIISKHGVSKTSPTRVRLWSADIYYILLAYVLIIAQKWFITHLKVNTTNFSSDFLCIFSSTVANSKIKKIMTTYQCRLIWR